MVSVEKRFELYKTLERDTKILRFYNFWFKKKADRFDQSPLVTDAIFQCGIHSLVDNSKLEEFKTHYIDIQRRNPSPTDSYLYDDYLFVIIIFNCVVYSLDKAWLLECIEARRCATDECNKIVLAYKNILNNTEGTHFEELLLRAALNDITGNKIRYPQKLYDIICRRDILNSSSDSLNIICLYIYDRLVSNSLIENSSKLEELAKFEHSFVSRSALISKVVYYSLCSLFIYCAYLLYVNEKYKNYFEQLDVFAAVLAVFGASGIIAEYTSKKKISRYVTVITYWLFQYSPASHDINTGDESDL